MKNFKFLNIVKENIIVVSALTVFIFLSILYINRFVVDAYYLDGLLQLPNVEKYYEGSLTIQDIFKPFGEHRLAGYTIIFLLNTIIFGLNLKLEPFIFLTTYIAIGLILYSQYKKFLLLNLKNTFERGIPLSSVIILACVFSLVHPPFMLMTTQFVIGTLLFLLAAILFDKMCVKNARWTIFVLFCCVLAVYALIFSGAYFGGCLISLSICVLVKILFSDSKKINLFLFLSTFFAIILMGSILFFTHSEGAGISDKVKVMFVHFGESFLTLLAGISASALDVHTLDEQLKNQSYIPLVNGAILFGLGVYAFYRFVALKMFRSTYLPLMLMMYSMGIIFIVHLSRLMGGWRWSMNEWYNFHYYFYLIGVLWILFYDFFKKIDDVEPSQELLGSHKYAKLFCVFFAGYILFVQLFSSYHQWNRAPHVKGFLENKRQVILSPTTESLAELYIAPEESLNAIRILKKYKLSSFRDFYKSLGVVGSNFQTAKPISGWYSWEGNMVWMAKESEAYFHTGTSGKMILKGTIFKENLPNKISILINDRKIKQFDILEPSVSFEVTGIPLDEIVNLKIILDHAIVPAQAGTGADVRELGMAVSSIVFQ